MKFLETIETIKAEEASVQRLFGGEGSRVRDRKNTPEYMEQFVEAVRFLSEIASGRRPYHYFQEAMSTSDFPLLFGDVLDRQLLAGYQETPASFRNYARTPTVPDFRTVRRLATDGAEGTLAKVPQSDEYPEAKLSEKDYTYKVDKYGRRLPFTWETMINDDVEAFASVPQRLGRAARRTEEKFATELFVDASGPHASFYTSGNKNIVTGNPALSIAGLQTAMKVLANQTDADGEPILLEAVELVVPPALEITAQNILNAIQLEVTEAGGTSGQIVHTQNWMRGRVRLNVNAYIPIVASSANGGTSWFLFANPQASRPALEIGFLRGHSEPEIFMKSPNATRIGGGEVEGDFDTDAIEFKVRHVLGGTRIDPKATVGSNGSGS